MKFLILVKSTPEAETGAPPSAELISEMMKYNEELSKAGVLLDLGGLQPSSKSARVRFEGKNRTVIDGPFTESKELVAGYWLIQVKSREEAIEWVKRVPNPTGDTGEIEIRPLFEMEDFPHAAAETVERAAKIDQQLKRS
ncbi:MAG TPA: YciI family protein [Kofleriaceae bacterium]